MDDPAVDRVTAAGHEVLCFEKLTDGRNIAWRDAKQPGELGDRRIPVPADSDEDWELCSGDALRFDKFVNNAVVEEISRGEQRRNPASSGRAAAWRPAWQNSRRRCCPLP